MALITRFEKVEKERNSVHAPVECGYLTFTGSDGARYLQLETYGSSERKLRDKVSQSIQLDESAAAELRRILDSAFPGSRRA